MGLKINLGCGTNVMDGWENVDHNPLLYQVYGTKIIIDGIYTYVMGLDDMSVDMVKAYHVLEHLEDLDVIMYELARVCRTGAKLDIVVPLGNTLWAIADPTHRREFNHRTFEYYCEGFDTSTPRNRPFKLLHRTIERQPNEWFDGIEWIVANLHVILERI